MLHGVYRGQQTTGAPLGLPLQLVLPCHRSSPQLPSITNRANAVACRSRQLQHKTTHQASAVASRPLSLTELPLPAALAAVQPELPGFRGVAKCIDVAAASNSSIHLPAALTPAQQEPSGL